MLPPTLLRAADRLIDALMAVARAAAAFGNDPASPEHPAQAARTLLYRLTLLVIRLVRLSNNPLPTPRQPGPNNTDPDDTTPTDAPSDRAPALYLPRHPGWLLALLPEHAPVLAADLQAALTDPAVTALLAAVPTLADTLRPVLRALGLDAAPQPAPPETPPPTPIHPPPGPHAAAHARSSERRPCLETPTPPHALAHPFCSV